jgi:hypothetical protein
MLKKRSLADLWHDLMGLLRAEVTLRGADERTGELCSYVDL